METHFFDLLGDCKMTRSKPVRAKVGDSRPEFRFVFHDDCTFDRTTLPVLRSSPAVSGLPFEVDMNAIAKQAQRFLSSIEADFIWLAVAVYIADRSSLRFPYGMSGPAHWRRRIHLEIPVSDTVAWENAAPALMHALEFLTEDDWTFEFIPGRSAFTAELQGHFPELSPPEVDWVCLFSGGLDSLAGALQWLQKADGVGLLVSGQTHNRLSAGQELQVAELRQHFSKRVEHLGVHYGFPDKQRQTCVGYESTQRTRAFVHTAIGSLAAIMSNRSHLLLFENGVGAINLPCDSAQFGSQNSRGTHPVFLRRMSAFVSRLFSRPFSIENPFGFETKAQMLSPKNVRHFGSLLQKSFSCDRFPNYPHAASQCGCCPSCLIRRLAFHGAGISDDAASYSTDIFHPRRALREGELLAVSKLTTQAESLAASLSQAEPWARLCSQWPDLLRTERELQSPSFRTLVINLLRRHVEEWDSFSMSFNPARLLALAA